MPSTQRASATRGLDQQNFGRLIGAQEFETGKGRSPFNFCITGLK